MKKPGQATIDIIKKAKISPELKQEITKFYQSIADKPDVENLLYDFLISKISSLSLDLTKSLLDDPKTHNETAELIKKYT